MAWVAVGIAALVGLTRLLPWLLAPKGPPPAPAPPPGFFRPTEAEWSSLSTAVVHTMRFSASVDTEGKVAVDDDLTTPVFSPYSGRVTRLYARAGDTVRKGDPLLAVAASELVQAQNDLISAAAARDIARAQLALARTNEHREEGLYAARGAALKDLEQAELDLAAADGGYRTAETALGAVRNRLRIFGWADSAIDALARSRHVAELSPVVVVAAPIGGVVTQRQVGLGQYLVSAAAGGSTPVFTIGDMSKVWLVADVREEDSPLMRRGESVEARVLAYPGRVFRGVLDYVAPGIDPGTRRLFVHAEIPNPGGALKPEMFADFSILTGPDAEAPAVPEEAVIYEGSEARVWVALPDHSLGLREIRVGRTENGRVEVLAGVSAGESVVTSGSLFIDRAAHAD